MNGIANRKRNIGLGNIYGRLCGATVMPKISQPLNEKVRIKVAKIPTIIFLI